MNFKTISTKYPLVDSVIESLRYCINAQAEALLMHKQNISEDALRFQLDHFNEMLSKYRIWNRIKKLDSRVLGMSDQSIRNFLKIRFMHVERLNGRSI